MRVKRWSIGVLAAVVVVISTWLLVADPSPGRAARGGPEATARKAAHEKATKARAAVRKGGLNGGYGYGGPCAAADLDVFLDDSLGGRGRAVCFQGDGNATGDNPDLGNEMFGGNDRGVANMTRDTRRCFEGSKAGAQCTTDFDCPGGRCIDPNSHGCESDAKGRSIFFIWNGNPDGTSNNDLGDELYVYDVKRRVTSRLTTQAGWCNSDATKPCTRDEECECPTPRPPGCFSTGCARASMWALQVSSNGRLALFATTGDPGGNPGHGQALFAADVKKGTAAIRPVAAQGRYCQRETQNRGNPCTTDADCGAVCGDGTVEAPEQCDGNGYSSTGCAPGLYCAAGGRQDQCTCVTPVCGNLVREPLEDCDGPDPFACGPFATCTPTCTCAPTTP